MSKYAIWLFMMSMNIFHTSAMERMDQHLDDVEQVQQTILTGIQFGIIAMLLLLNMPSDTIHPFCNDESDTCPNTFLCRQLWEHANIGEMLAYYVKEFLTEAVCLEIERQRL